MHNVNYSRFRPLDFYSTIYIKNSNNLIPNLLPKDFKQLYT